MFYDTRLLSKTGRLGEIWLIANQQKVDSKIIKIVLETDIHRTIQTIMESNLPPLSLRLYAYLLHGVIKLYHHKVVRLYEDSSKSLSSINAYRSQKDDITKKKAPRKDTALTLKEKYNIDLDLTIPDIAGLDIIDEIDMLEETHIAPHTAITYGELDEQLIEDESQLPLSTPSARDYLGDFDPHHYSPEIEIEPIDKTTEISEEISIDQSQALDQSQGLDLGELEIPPVDQSVEIPSHLIGDIFEADLSMVGGEAEIEDEAQKNADINDLERSARPRSVVIRPDKTSLLSHRKLQNNIEEYEVLTRELEAPTPKRRKIDEEIAHHLSLPLLPFDANLNQSLLEIVQSAFDTSSPYSNIPQITREEEEVIEAARRASSVAPLDESISGPPLISDFESFIPELEEEFQPVAMEEEEEDEEKAKKKRERRTLSLQHARAASPSPPPVKRKKKTKRGDERFESVRTQSVHGYMGKLFRKSGGEQIAFSESLRSKSKSTVSQIFYELLVLKSLNIIDINQSHPERFSEIYLNPTENFEA